LSNKENYIRIEGSNEIKEQVASGTLSEAEKQELLNIVLNMIFDPYSSVEIVGDVLLALADTDKLRSHISGKVPLHVLMNYFGWSTSLSVKRKTAEVMVKLTRIKAISTKHDSGKLIRNLSINAQDTAASDHLAEVWKELVGQGLANDEILTIDEINGIYIARGYTRADHREAAAKIAISRHARTAKDAWAAYEEARPVVAKERQKKEDAKTDRTAKLISSAGAMVERILRLQPNELEIVRAYYYLLKNKNHSQASMFERHVAGENYRMLRYKYSNSLKPLPAATTLCTIIDNGGGIGLIDSAIADSTGVITGSKEANEALILPAGKISASIIMPLAGTAIAFIALAPFIGVPASVLASLSLMALTVGAISASRAFKKPDLRQAAIDEIIKPEPKNVSKPDAESGHERDWQKELLRLSLEIEGVRAQILQILSAKYQKLMDMEHVSRRPKIAPTSVIALKKEIIKRISEKDTFTFPAELEAKLEKLEDLFDETLKARNASSEAIRIIAGRREYAKAGALAALKQIGETTVNIYVNNQAAAGFMGTAKLIADALTGASGRINVNIFVLGGSAAPEEIDFSSDDASGRIRIIKISKDEMLAGNYQKQARVHVGIGETVNFAGENDAVFENTVLSHIQGYSSSSSAYYRRLANSDIEDPSGTLFLDPGLLTRRQAKDSLWTADKIRDERKQWLERNLLSACLGELNREAGLEGWKLEDAVWTWGYFQDTQNFFDEMQTLSGAFSGNNAAAAYFTPEGKQLVINLVPGFIARIEKNPLEAEDLAKMGMRVITYEGEIVRPTGPVQLPITIIMHRSIDNKELKALQSELSGTLKRDKENKFWIDFPAYVTGTASWLEAVSSGSIFLHDNFDSGRGNRIGVLVSTIIRMLALEDAGKPSPRSRDELAKLAKEKVGDFLAGQEHLNKYSDLEGWSRQAREYTDMMFKFNMVDDILSCLERRLPLAEPNNEHSAAGLLTPGSADMAKPASWGVPRMVKEEPAAAAAKQVQAEADGIHKENLKHTPVIADNTILCHIVADSILPETQRPALKKLEQDMRGKEYIEKVVSLSIKDPNDPTAFMAKLNEIKAREEANCPAGYKIQFDVACPNKDLVKSIQDKGMQALAFEKEGEGDMVQFEGIILALRVLRTGSIEKLLGIYKFLSGKDLSAVTNDINELARAITFILPARRLDVNSISVFNNFIKENIKSAA
jgi:hypothetical protein